jgi:DNA polymerase-3 subunit delta'
MSWQGIQGHDQVADRFRRTLAHGRLANTFLFVGPSGIGKRKFALRLAQALLCPYGDPAGLPAAAATRAYRSTRGRIPI